MKKKRSKILKVFIGILISLLFFYLAFNKIDYAKMKNAFQEIDYWFLLAAIFTIFVSHWARSIRFQIILSPLKNIPVSKLFSATMIGQMGNAVLPMHLGEIFRANVAANWGNISTSSVLAAILMERILDVLSLLVIMVLTMIVYPFPAWVRTSGLIMFGCAAGIIFILFLMSQKHEKTLKFFGFFLNHLPTNVSNRIKRIINEFIKGIYGLPKKGDYFMLIIFSTIIWIAYWAVFQFIFYAFSFSSIYNVDLLSPLVVLVITMIGIVIPSSPGYIGTYHYLCQLSLELFGIPRSIGLLFAFVAHAVNIIFPALFGFLCAWKEGVDRYWLQKS